MLTRFWCSEKENTLFTDPKDRQVKHLLPKEKSCDSYYIWPKRNSDGSKKSRSGGGVLPCKRLMGMCCWMGSHFHDWIDSNGVAFSTESLEWARTFSDFWSEKASYLRLANLPV